MIDRFLPSFFGPHTALTGAQDLHFQRDQKARSPEGQSPDLFVISNFIERTLEMALNVKPSGQVSFGNG
jgi:hypothetical protein